MINISDYMTQMNFVCIHVQHEIGSFVNLLIYSTLLALMTDLYLILLLQILSQMYMSLDLLSPMPHCGNQLRYNLMEGPLRLRDMNTKLDVHCILFTDMLLFTKPWKRDKLRIIKPPIRIDSLSIHEMKDNRKYLSPNRTDYDLL